MSDALEDGLRLLAGRSLTRAEVESRLRRKGHADADVEAAMERLSAASAVDDARVARHWICSQAAARGRGRDRAVAELCARGVDEATAAAAWSQAIADGAIEEESILVRAVRRRLGPPPGRASMARLARVYNALLYEGFTSEEIEAHLTPYGFERTDP